MEVQTSLFENTLAEPLPSRLRPKSLDEIAGQRHLLGEGCILRKMIEEDVVPSLIFFGPPGVGKTTLAGVIAHVTKARFINFSAVNSGIKEIREVMKNAKQARMYGEKTIVFVDEIHRFNKAQQDAFLPFVENGSIILIGATTENPSFEVNSALLSRCKVFMLKELSNDEILLLLHRALTDKRGFGRIRINIAEDLLSKLAIFSNGDARKALSILEMAVLNGEHTQNGVIISEKNVEQCTSRKLMLYDKNGEEHYNIISALHKSMRNSDPDTAIYWLARMLEGGEDPLYIARRITRFASEDIGLADPRALEIAVAAFQACHFIGMPECTVHLTEAVVYMSLAPKSNALYMAYGLAKKDAQNLKAEPVPLWLRNAPTKLMKDLEYGKGYQYAHDSKEKLTTMNCLPETLQDRTYYHPTQEGFEERLAKRLADIKEWKKQQRMENENKKMRPEI